MTPRIEHQGYTMPNGYGQVKRDGRAWLAHRWAYKQANGTLPDDLVVRHKCDNRKCVNPEHLEVGTQGDNLSDRKAHGHRYRKLTKEDVADIKQRLTTESGASIARLYGVTRQLIGHIKHGRQWSEV